jgi:hypothetical protein
MSIELLTAAIGLVFVALLLVGRGQIAKGTNPSVANGAVVLVLAAIVGIWALGLLVSWEGW